MITAAEKNTADWPGRNPPHSLYPLFQHLPRRIAPIHARHPAAGMRPRAAQIRNGLLRTTDKRMSCCVLPRIGAELCYTVRASDSKPEVVNALR